MSKEDDRARDEFTSEAEELLETLSRDLVDFESQGRNVRPEVINKIFRDNEFAAVRNDPRFSALINHKPTAITE